MKSLVIVFVFMTSVSAQVVCGPDGAQVSIVGSSTVEPIARSWAEGYKILCPNVIVNVAGGGSTVGVRRVCNSTQPPADIGTMSRKWTPITETNVTNDATGKYICNFGTKTRTITQVDVAIDGITFILINVGLAAQCLRKLSGQGQGLSIDQLRWIYSNYTDPQKEATGWDKASIPFDDNNETSHNWNEIGGVFCPNTEIKLSSPGPLSGTFSIFKEIVLPNSNEAIPLRRPSRPFITETNEELVTFVETSSLEFYGDGIGYLSFASFINEGAILYGVPIKNKGASVWIKPSVTTIEDGSYVPFTRRIYMNIWDGSLVNTKPYIEYGLNQAGISRVRAVGFVALPESELPCLAARVGAQIFPTSTTTNGTSPVTCILPTKSPTKQPTKSPTKQPTKSPTKRPTYHPTKVPTKRPTLSPTLQPIDTNDTCGLFGLNLFCPFTFCGVFGRFLGFCS